MFSLPTIATNKPRDADTIVSRADLTTLLASIREGIAGLTGRVALERAARIVSAWCATRSRIDARFASSSWRRDMGRLARTLFALASGKGMIAKWRPAFRVFNLNGNTKLPFAAFSTLPVVTCPGAGECVSWCYSFTGWRYPAAFARQLQNTLLLWFAPEVVRTAFDTLPSGVTLRLYVDGDFDSLATVRFWMDALTSRPDIRAYGYSKSWDLLREYDTVTGGAWPTNYALNLSNGARAQATLAQMERLTITRGQFVTVSIRGLYRPAKTGRIGFERYSDRRYHAAVRKAARDSGIVGPIFSCPGTCGTCTVKEHACGDNSRFSGIVIVNGEH